MNINQDTCPLALFSSWFDDARGNADMDYPNAFTLSTVDDTNFPESRIVLAKAINNKEGYLVFYTNYQSRKGQHIFNNNHVSALFYWDKIKKQVRISGQCISSPKQESDDYFASRPIENQINASLSQQSQPIDDYSTLMTSFNNILTVHKGKADQSIKRPAYWGGFRLYFSSLEFWIAGSGRFHQRYKYERTINNPSTSNISGTPWSLVKLQP
jgi:pyridoxamine 5'-phosphate oxidase